MTSELLDSCENARQTSKCMQTSSFTREKHWVNYSMQQMNPIASLRIRSEDGSFETLLFRVSMFQAI